MIDHMKKLLSKILPNIVTWFLIAVIGVTLAASKYALSLPQALADLQLTVESLNGKVATKIDATAFDAKLQDFTEKQALRDAVYQQNQINIDKRLDRIERKLDQVK